MKRRILLSTASIALLVVVVIIVIIVRRPQPTTPTPEPEVTTRQEQPQEQTPPPPAEPQPEQPSLTVPSRPPREPRQPSPDPPSPRQTAPVSVPAHPAPPQPQPPAPQPAPPAPQPTPPPAPPTPSKYDVGPADIGEIIELVNAERSAHGKRALAGVSSLHASAQAHSVFMASVNKASHEGGLDRLLQHTPNCGAGAENVLYQPAGSTSRDAFLLWKNSSGHLDNMLGGYSRTGVGIVLKNNRHYITMHFCS